MKNSSRNIKVQRILQVAEEVFLEYGYDKASIRLITERANINNAMLHYYFKDKENLFNKMVIERIMALKKAKYSALTNNNPSELLMGIIEHYLNLIDSYKDFYKLLVIELLKKENTTLVNHINSFFRFNESQICQILKQGIHKGVFREVNKELVAKNIMGILINMLVIKNNSAGYQNKNREELMLYFKNFYTDFLI